MATDPTSLRNDPHFVPPSGDLEQHLLAALLTDNRRLADVGGLEREHFGYEVHGRIFEVIRHLVTADLPATPATMTHVVVDDPKLTGFLRKLTSSVVSYTPHAVTHWASELIALAAQRSLVALGNDLGRIFLDAAQPSYVERVEAVFSEFETLKGNWQRDHTAKTRLGWLDPLRLENDPQITRQWLVEGWLPMGETCGLGGAGGEGKTLSAHQLATVAALGYGEWLGMRVTPMKAALVLCEDNANDTHWRQVKINRLYKCSMQDLAGELFLLPRREAESNYLATFDKNNNMTLTPFFHELLAELKAFGVRLVVLDTREDVFNGDQNSPIHARKFVRGVCDRIARELNGIVLLVYHPSRTGMSEGDYQSGSVQWNSAYRARLVLSRGDDAARVLSLIKTNLAPPAEAIQITWQDGAFIRKPVDSGLSRRAEIDKAHRVFQQLRDSYEKQGRPVSVAKQGNYAPRVFAADPDCEGCEEQHLEQAMLELLKEGKIVSRKPSGERSARLVKVA